MLPALPEGQEQRPPQSPTCRAFCVTRSTSGDEHLGMVGCGGGAPGWLGLGVGLRLGLGFRVRVSVRARARARARVRVRVLNATETFREGGGKKEDTPLSCGTLIALSTLSGCAVCLCVCTLALPLATAWQWLLRLVGLLLLGPHMRWCGQAVGRPSGLCVCRVGIPLRRAIKYIAA